MSCHWVRDSQLPGGKFWVPECWGGLYDPDGCYCPKVTRDQLEKRIAKLEREVAEIKKARLTPLDAERR